ncbi:MAG: hypothetical protein SFU91_02510 [Chloroherpetonaceae bacterium]|nr:hypothetical protein [Chloroherpetonaceae bacterium]
MNPLDSVKTGVETFSKDAITLTTFVFFIYLTLAITVERILEYLNSLFKYVEMRHDFFSGFWLHRAKFVQEKLELAYALQQNSAIGKTVVESFSSHLLSSSKEGEKKSISIEKVRIFWVKAVNRVMSFFLALFLLKVVLQNTVLEAKSALLLKSILDVYGFNRFKSIFEFLFDNIGQEGLEISLTAPSVFIVSALISMGVEPLHNLIVQAEKKLKSSTEKSS